MQLSSSQLQSSQLQSSPPQRASFQKAIGARYLGHRPPNYHCCEFTVWAPEAKAVAVKTVAPQKRVIPLHYQTDGYWQATATDIVPGTLYFYQLDDGAARPDPASYYQPQGVHGPSQVIDHQFDWQDQDWQDQDWQDQKWSGIPLAEYIIYELHVGTFTPEGTFEAMIQRLPELRELGVTAIEIMPIAQFPGERDREFTNESIAASAVIVKEQYRNWGYDGVYPFAVQNSYGDPQALKQLVEACHQQGIAVILDVVYNHFGPEGNYLRQFAPAYFTETYRTPWGEAINYDGMYSHDVRNFFIQNALYWLQHYHIDALRLDAVHAIYDFGAKHILQELGEAVRHLSEQQGRMIYLIAESDLNDAKVIRSALLGGYGMDAQWSDDFHHALHALLTREEMGYYQDFGRCEQLVKAYQDTFVYDWQYAPHRQRFHGNSAIDLPLSQFVVCIQNHDQIGNRMVGDRLSQLVSFEALKLAAGAVLLSPYIPLLFMGEEYGEDAPFAYFVSHSDPDLIAAVRQGRKAEFAAFQTDATPPDPESQDTFLRSKLQWHKRHAGKHQALWNWYQQLIHLRRSLPALLVCDRQNITAAALEHQQIVWWRRWSENQQLLCLMNFNTQPVEFKLDFVGDRWQKVLDSADPTWLGEGTLLPEMIVSGQEIEMRSHSIALYQVVS